MADETRRLAIALDDDTSAPATSAAASLENLAGSLDRMGAAAVDASGKPALVADSLRELALQADKLAGAKPPALVSADYTKAISGISKLSSAMELAAKRAEALRKAEAAADKEAFTRANRIPTALQSSPQANSLFNGLIQGVGRIFGQGAAGDVTAGAAKLVEASDRLAPVMPLLKAGGGFLMSGATAVAAAAAALVIAAAAIAYKLGEFIAKTAIAETQFRQGSINALDKVSGGKGTAEFELSLKLAKDLNIDREDAVARVKSLLQLGFKGEQIPIVVETLADFQAVKGDEKAAALRSQLEKIAAKGKVNEESIKGLAEAGVSVEGVLGRLQKKGESLNETMARLKTNQVSSAEAIAAITAEVESKVGGVARKSGESIDGLLNAIKIDALGLFADIDTGPLKEVLASIKSLLESDSGKALKAALTEAGNALFGLLKPLQGDAGKEKLAQFLEKATAAASAFATLLTKFQDTGAFDVLIGYLIIARGYMIELAWVIDKVSAAFGVLKGMVTGDGAGYLGSLDKLFGTKFSEQKAPTVDTSGATASALAGGASTGQAFSDGFIGAIKAGAVGAVNAAVDLVKGAIGGAAAAQDSHSPSRVTAKLGSYFAQGFTGSLGAANDNAATAGAKFVQAATGGAASATAAAPVPDVGAGVSAAPAPNVEINVSVSGAAPGQAPSAEDIAAAVRRELIAFFRATHREAA